MQQWGWRNGRVDCGVCGYEALYFGRRLGGRLHLDNGVFVRTKMDSVTKKLSFSMFKIMNEGLLSHYWKESV